MSQTGIGSERVSNLPEVTQRGLSDSKCWIPVLVQVRLEIGTPDSACCVAHSKEEGPGQLGL